MTCTKLIIAGICGCVSGILSAWLPDVIGANSWVWLPGAMFGWMFTSYFMCVTPSYQPSLKYLRWILFIVLSTAAYYSAVFVFGSSASGSEIDSSKDWLLGIPAGFVGSSILVMSIWLCSFRVPSWRPAVVTILLGGLLGLLIGYDSILKAYPLFVLWQTVVFVGLVFILPKDLFKPTAK
jgi:hypothetical protein